MSTDDQKEIKLLGPGKSEKPNDITYYQRMEKATETIRQAVIAGEVDIELVMNMVTKVEEHPLTQFSFFNTETGAELTAHELIVAWYKNATNDVVHGNDGTALYLEEERTARDLANRVIDAWGFRSNEIDVQYGPFAQYAKKDEIIQENARNNLSEAEKKQIEDPEISDFLKKKVWGIAIPNIAYTRRMKEQLVKDLRAF